MLKRTTKKTKAKQIEKTKKSKTSKPKKLQKKSSSVVDTIKTTQTNPQAHKTAEITIKQPTKPISSKKIALNVQTTVKNLPSINIELQETERPPVVVALGQVDHGKTTLLDYIRQTRIAEKEIGGITQDIGAYEAEYNNEKIIFIDTPGHQAFSKLRTYGSKIADVGILIIDATEGLKDQTIESLNVLQNSKVPFVIAINKIDKSGANPQKVKNELLKVGIQTEDMGGDIPSVNISAITGKGVDELLELVILLGKLANLKVNKQAPGSGFVVSAYEDSKTGIKTDIILKNGRLKIGDYIVSDTSFGKIKKIEDSFSRQLTKAIGPKPLRIYGFQNIPDIGEKFYIVENEDEFENLKQEISQRPKPKKENIIFGNPNGKYSLNILIKVPSHALKDAILNLLKNLKLKNSFINITNIDIGDINFNDVLFADSTNSLILGFKIKITKEAKSKAEELKVKCFLYEIIYEMEKNIYELIHQNIKKETVKNYIGCIKIIKIFRQEKDYQILGAKMDSKNKAKKTCRFEILRRSFKIGDGKILDLEQNKVKLNEIENDREFGIMIHSDIKIALNDELLVYEEKTIEPEI